MAGRDKPQVTPAAAKPMSAFERLMARPDKSPDAGDGQLQPPAGKTANEPEPGRDSPVDDAPDMD